MARRWDHVACLTLCALAVPALNCQGSHGGSVPPSAQEGGAQDGRPNHDDGGTGNDGASSDGTPDTSRADIGSPLDARPIADGPPSDAGPSPDVMSTVDAAADAVIRDTGGGGDPTGPILYAPDLTHSIINASVAAVLRNIAATVPTRNTHNFLKAGDPIMGDALGSPTQVIQGDFFGCVESPAPMKDLATYASLQETIDYFHQGNVGGRSPFAHVSQCTRENLTSWDLLSQKLLPSEIIDANPSLAFVMFGSVDIGNGGTFTPSPQVDWVKFRDYGQAMLDIEDALMAAGVVPVLFSMPPRLYNGAPVVQVPTFVALTRAIAQGRQTPFVDFNLQMRKLADQGLDSDGLHITQYEVAGSARNCVFSEDGLKHGYNLMNLLGLEALERVKKVVADGADSLPGTAETLAGQGTVDAPFDVPLVPFSDLRDLAKASSRVLESYNGCGTAKEAGGEYVYRWNVGTSTRARAVVIDRKGSPVAAHVYHLAGPPPASNCVASQSSGPSNGGFSAGTLPPGTHYFVVDSAAVPAGRSAEYLLALVACDPTDMTCN